LYLKNRIQERSSEKLVVVVSAKQHTTNALEQRARQIVETPSVGTLDLLWATGELRSVALLSLYLEEIRVPSIGLNVHETGLVYSAEISSCLEQPTFRGSRLCNAIAKHAVVAVPGFFATRSDGSIVSLGRGGSDLSAVLLAIGIGADQCELIKDVP